MKIKNYIRKDKTHVYKKGKYKLFEFSKRPHGGYCCFVFNKGGVVSGEGYHGTSLPFKFHAVKYGMRICRELKIIK